MRTSAGFLRAIALSLVCCASAVAGTATVLPPHSVIGGTSIQDYTAQWWQQVYSIPSATNPIKDTTGAITQADGNHGEVFFLYGTNSGTATRNVSVGADKYLFFPVVNVAVDNSGWLRLMTNAELTNVTEQYANIITSEFATIDGQAVPALSSHIELSQPFTVPLVPNNVIGDAPGGTTDAVSSGYWLAVAPLSVGEHTLTFGGTIDGSITLPKGVAGPGTVSVPITANIGTTYHVDVVPLPSGALAAGLTLPLLFLAVRRMRFSRDS